MFWRTVYVMFLKVCNCLCVEFSSLELTPKTQVVAKKKKNQTKEAILWVPLPVILTLFFLSGSQCKAPQAFPSMILQCQNENSTLSMHFLSPSAELNRKLLY